MGEGWESVSERGKTHLRGAIPLNLGREQQQVDAREERADARLVLLAAEPRTNLRILPIVDRLADAP